MSNRSKKRRAQERKIQGAVESVLEFLESKDDPAHDSVESKKAFWHAHVRRARQSRFRPQLCMYPGCTRISVSRSHVLPRSGPLELIAEAGHVVTPIVNAGSGMMEFRTIGIGEASTFPGFCPQHENAFRQIDTTKALGTAQDWALQFFRTVCWEIQILRRTAQNVQRTTTEYTRILERKAVELLSAEFRQRVDNLSIRGDWRQREAQKQVEYLNDLVGKYTEDFLVPLQREIQGSESGLEPTILEIEDTRLPVCLAGKGNFHCETADGVESVDGFMVVFPTIESTLLALLVPVRHTRLLKIYMSTVLSRALGPLNMVESWMMHGTDHWYLSPSVWLALPRARRELIQKEFVQTQLSIGESYDRSIFDSQRHAALASQEGRRLPSEVRDAELRKLRND